MNAYSSDIGSTIKREALRMAKQEARRNPGNEVRIAVCTTADDFCTAEIIVQAQAI